MVLCSSLHWRFIIFIPVGFNLYRFGRPLDAFWTPFGCLLETSCMLFESQDVSGAHFLEFVNFNDFGSTFESNLNAYGSLCVPFVHASFSSFFHRFPGSPGCQLLRVRRQRRHPLKSGRGFPQETLQAVRVGPRMVFKE